MVNKPVLVLNQNYEPLGICNVKRAVVLVFLGKAEALNHVENGFLHSMKLIFPVPVVVRLHLYKKVPRKQVVLSRKNILIRDNSKCQYCGRNHSKQTVDHVIPRVRGGKEIWENLVCACTKCNKIKGNKTPEEAGMKLLQTPRMPSYISFFRYHVSSVHDTWKPYLFMN